MPPPSPAPPISYPSLTTIFKSLHCILHDRTSFWPLFILLLFFETSLNGLIISYIPYTEIDWTTYMQQVAAFLAGERDYANLQGDTGPLVYPAGFVYIYAALARLTSLGTNIHLAQLLFAILYITTIAIVCLIYAHTDTPPYIMALLALSRRMHSIYVLRLFNDGWAMLPMYACILAMLHRKWILASILYSIALSVKMNILLYAPAYALAIVKTHPWASALAHACIIVSIQVLLSLPFLSHPSSYMARSFELGRRFTYKWSVNWKFLAEDTFQSRPWAVFLIFAHLITLLAFLVWRWCRRDGGLWMLLKRAMGVLPRLDQRADDMVHMMFTCNFVGIVFARTLHYQFYSWYFMTLPYLLWRTRLSVVTRLLLLGVIEVCWNVYPSTPLSSSALGISHLIVLAAVAYGDSDQDSGRVSNGGFDRVQKAE
ncbi:dolichyl-P-Man:Man5GlcNAc2-PP-dolichol alpha-1,3-mannosyltransferase [Synchytrium endobioticum]|uniref:Dol-P-Man:Man(5)GlcNAc(2)-PP-Dol alpha-1,3-mannosyltransferase n=1 Tax=Synchytrium endobioticum TaxID=286115 RepID=A0A507D4K3_9FUNG|nr:dolichyl-P-Man:Man5GlcNAc2-PP-dolichol alpha-1,3-mannosyltransferase [Synchytrium endobioticum]